ncbi:unnamed protein product [Aureobasidium pullulans]|nr:unnamed protein product [Aureobasidium pullulans]CAD0049810.1 unnamed protein product [Aureobasidium pullulans]
MMDYANHILEILYVAVPKYQKARVTTVFKDRRWWAILWSWDNRTTSEWVYEKTQKMRVELNE